MSAKELWLSLETITKYEETKEEINIYDRADDNYPFVTFLKSTEDIMFSAYQDEDITKPSIMISCIELQAINKQVEELGWNK